MDPLMFISRSTTTSLVARLYSQPPNMSTCGPIDVDVCPYRFNGGVPSNLPLSHDIFSVFNTTK